MNERLGGAGSVLGGVLWPLHLLAATMGSAPQEAPPSIWSLVCFCSASPLTEDTRTAPQGPGRGCGAPAGAGGPGASRPRPPYRPLPEARATTGDRGGRVLRQRSRGDGRMSIAPGTPTHTPQGKQPWPEESCGRLSDAGKPAQPPLSPPLGTGHLSPLPAPRAGGPTTVLPDEPSQLRDILRAFLTMLGADGATGRAG